MIRLTILFISLSIFAILLSATGIYRFDFQLDKISLTILMVTAALIGFLLGNLISYRSKSRSTNSEPINS